MATVGRGGHIAAGLALVLFGMVSAVASAAAAPHELRDATAKVVLGHDLEVLEDPSGSLRFDDVLAPGANARFREVSDPIPNFGFSSSAYWLRTTLAARHVGQRDWRVHLGYPLLDRVDFYLEQPEGHFEHYRTGDLLPFAARPIEHTDFVVPMRTTAGSSPRIYIRVESESAVQVPLTLWAPEALARRDRVTNLWMGMFYGLVLVLVLYNLLLAVMVRDRSYVYFCGFALAFLTVQAGMDGYLYAYLLGSWPTANGVAVPLGTALTAATGMQFARHFMNLESLPRLDRIASVIVIISAALALVSLFAPYRLSIRFSAGFALLACPLLLYVGMSALRRGIAVARFFVLAWLIFLLGSVVLILCRFGVLPFNMITTNGPKIGFVANVILLSLALGDRIRSVKAEKELAERKALEERARAAAKDELARFIVHDLKNPLTIIGGNLELLMDSEGLGDEDRVSVTSSLAATESVMRMVMDLLDVSRADDGALVAHPKQVPAATVFDEVAASMRQWLARSGHELVVAPSDVVLCADRALLVRVLENLIDNAAKYSPPGPVSLEVVTRDDAEVVRVVDRGRPIATDQRERIFEKYHRLATPVPHEANERTSRGLGLVFCRLAARAHGGDVWVESCEAGNVFCVSLPRAAPSAREKLPA